MYFKSNIPEVFWTTGATINNDTGSFTLQNTNEFKCNKSGTLYIIGHGTSRSGTYGYYKILNGVKSDLSGGYDHYMDVIEVSEGDILQLVFRNNAAGVWSLATLSLIL